MIADLEIIFGFLGRVVFVFKTSLFFPPYLVKCRYKWKDIRWLSQQESLSG